MEKETKWVRIVVIILILLVVAGLVYVYVSRRPAQELVPADSRAGAFMEKNIPFTTILKGQQSGVIEKKNIVVKKEADWRNLWNEINANQTPPPELPEIDFSKEMVIGVFTGRKNTGGYGVGIVKIMERNAGLEVSVVESAPEPDQIVTQALTSPFHLVRLPFSNKEVIFKSVLGAEKGF